MTYVTNNTNSAVSLSGATVTPGSQTLFTDIDYVLVTLNGWTKTGTLPYTYSKTSAAGHSLSFSLVSIQQNYVQFAFNGRNFYATTGAGNLAGNNAYTLAASDSHFFFKIQGPTATEVGAYNYTYGSGHGYFMITSFTPYYTTDNATANQVACFSSHNSSVATDFTHLVYVKLGLSSTSNAVAELVTMRPAVQDIVAVGDLIPNNSALSNVVYWPYVIIEQNDGLRGRLDNVLFASDYNASLAGDSNPVAAYQLLNTMVIDSITYNLTGGVYLPAATSYGPLGTSGIPNTTVSSTISGGPWIMVRG